MPLATPLQSETHWPVGMVTVSDYRNNGKNNININNLHVGIEGPTLRMNRHRSFMKRPSAKISLYMFFQTKGGIQIHIQEVYKYISHSFHMKYNKHKYVEFMIYIFLVTNKMRYKGAFKSV